MNCNNTGTLTAGKHAHTCPKPKWRFSRGSASNKLTFKRTRESFEEREIQSKVCFWAKISKKKHFFINRLQLKRFKPGFLDNSKYFTSTNSKNFLGNSLIFKISHKFKCAEKTSHFNSWKNNCKTALRSGNMFCIKFRVLLKVFSFFPRWNTAI